jgi:hypothetical protein
LLDSSVAMVPRDSDILAVVSLVGFVALMGLWRVFG